jgi:ribosomal protein S18 acetylase RimI-like enzyme
MDLIIKNFTIEDYSTAFKLWKTDDNVGLSSADTIEGIKIFLKRNLGLSKVAIINGNMVATLLCGHDGRRGYLYHLFVDKSQRRQRLGSKLVEACLNSLRKEGITKCHLFVFERNELGKEFWTNTSWQERDDIAVFSKDI